MTIEDFRKIRRLTRGISLEDWTPIIEASDVLEPVEDREMVSPFTKETIPVPGEGKAYFIEDGEKVGNIVLENGELLTTGVPRSACNAIASQLGAIVLEDDRS